MRHFICALPLLCAPLLAAPDSAAEKVSLRSVASADAQPRPRFPELPLTMLRERPANAGAIPKLSESGMYARVRAGGKDFICGFDAPAGSFALGKLHVGGAPAIAGRAMSQGKAGFHVEFRDVPVGSTMFNFRLVYSGNRLVDGVCEPSHHRRGQLAFEGVLREVILVDADGDGRYNGDEDRWIALKSDRSRRVSALRKPAMSRMNEPQVPFAEDGSALMVREVAPDGSTLELVRGKPRVALDKVLARRYEEFRTEHFREFRQEKASFERRAHIETGRPRTKAKAVWPRISLEEAKERSRRTGRPLLVAFYTETNVWWWRYAYYTFPDREVDTLLRQFVLAAIDAEKGGVEAFQKSGASSLPTLIAYSTAGRPIAFRFRSRDQTGKVRDLEITRSGATGWLTPQDLAVNLQRILKAAKGG